MISLIDFIATLPADQVGQLYLGICGLTEYSDDVVGSRSDFGMSF